MGSGEEEFRSVDQFGGGKFTEQLVDVPNRFSLLFHAEHRGGHQEIGVVKEFGRRAPFNKSPQHDCCGLGLFRIDQAFGLVEGRLAGASRRFGLAGTGRRWRFGRGSCFAECKT